MSAKKIVNVLATINNGYLGMPSETLVPIALNDTIEDLAKKAKVPLDYLEEGASYTCLSGTKEFRFDAQVKEAIENKYLDILPQCDANIKIGRFFVFCKNDQNSSFLHHLGFDSIPAIVPRLSCKDLESSLHEIKMSRPAFETFAVIATDRLVYEPGDKVSAFAICSKGLKQRKIADARCYLTSSAQEVPGTEKIVCPKHRLFAVHWENLPAGHYTAVIEWNEQKNQCEFTIGEFSISGAQATWQQEPVIEKQGNQDHLCGTVAVKLHGIPVANVKMQKRLEGDGQYVTFTTNEQGIAPIKLPNNPEATYLEIQWQEGGVHSAQLPLTCLKQTKLGEVELSGIAQSDSKPAAGIHVVYQPQQSDLLQITSVVAQEVTAVAHKHLDAVVVIGVFPGTKRIRLELEDIKQGEKINFALPANISHGYLFLGALTGEECFEKLLPVFASSKLKVNCEIEKNVVAGEQIKAKIEVNEEREIPIAVVVRDSRLHSGGGLNAVGAKTKMENLQKEWEQFATASGTFSQYYIAAQVSFIRKEQPPNGIYRGGPFGGGGGSYNSPLIMASSNEDLYSPTLYMSASPLASQQSEDLYGQTFGSSLEMFAPSENPYEAPIPTNIALEQKQTVVVQKQNTIFADVVLVEKTKEITLDIPDSATGYTVDLLALDPCSQGWSVCQAHFQARQPLEIHADSLPACTSSKNKISGSITIIAQSSSFTFSAECNGEPLKCHLEDGTQVTNIISCSSNVPVTIFIEELKPGHYTFTAGKESFDYVKKVWIKPLDCISERVRRLVVLEEGQSFSSDECSHIFQVLFVEDPKKILQSCGQAVANYSHACCEQTAAKMLGAFLAWSVGDQKAQSQSLSSLYQGYKRLESMWTSKGFAMYPNMKDPCKFWGPLAYQHLLVMGPLSQMVALDKEMQALLQNITKLAQKAQAAYGFKEEINSCSQAYLMLAKQPREALDFVLNNWEVTTEDTITYGVVKNGEMSDINIVEKRAQTCYAATVLLSDPIQRKQRKAELMGTLNWLGQQMKDEGRFYSTPDSAALVPLLMSLSKHDFLESGKVCLDAATAILPEEANKKLGKKLPQNIFCSEGQIQFLLDGVYKTTLPGNIEIGNVAAQWEKNGDSVMEGNLGETIDLVIDCGGYKAGTIAHIALPPCMAFEKGGARLQLFERDFQGQNKLRIPCKVVDKTKNGPQSGVVVIRNMYEEKELTPMGIELSVN